MAGCFFSLMDIFLGAWTIPPLDFSNSNSWPRDLSSQLNWLLPLIPGSSGSLPWTDSHSWSTLFHPARPLEQTLKWLPAGSPSHTDHIWPMKEHPITLQGSTVTSPIQQQLPFAPSCQPVSLSLLISSLVNMGWIQNIVLPYNRLSFPRKASLGLWQKIKYMKQSVCILARIGAFWTHTGCSVKAAPWLFALTPVA